VKHKFQENITKIISRGTSRPLAGRAGREACLRDLFANKKLFLFAKRPSGGASKFFWTSHPLSGRGVPSPTPPARSTGGCTHFPNFSHPAPLFQILFFYPLFRITSRGAHSPRRISQPSSISPFTEDIPAQNHMNCCTPSISKYKLFYFKIYSIYYVSRNIVKIKTIYYQPTLPSTLLKCCHSC
jgi:hypothetical protein